MTATYDWLIQWGRSVENSSFSTMSLGSPVWQRYLVLYRLCGTLQPFYLHSTGKHELRSKGKTVINFIPRKERNRSKTPYLISSLTSLTFKQLWLSAKKLIALELMGDPHYRRLINETYIWISNYPFFSFLFPKGITGIWFAEHQRCYIRTQSQKLPAVAEVEDRELVCFLSQPSVPQTP